MKRIHLPLVPYYKKLKDFIKNINSSADPLSQSDKKDLFNTIENETPIGRFNFSEDKESLYDVKTGEGISYEKSYCDIIKNKFFTFFYSK